MSDCCVSDTGMETSPSSFCNSLSPCLCVSSSLQVLKAIGLQRTGKQDEAFTLAQEVATLEPTDDNSLQALTILYREMHRREYTHTHTQVDDDIKRTCMFDTAPVVHSGVGGEAVRSRREEGPPERGVSLSPLHGVRPRRRVQEDAAGERADVRTCT